MGFGVRRPKIGATGFLAGFLAEIHDWEEMIVNLDTLEVPYSPPLCPRLQRRALHIHPRPRREHDRAGAAPLGAAKLKERNRGSTA